MRRRGQVVLLLAFLFFLLERGWGIPLGSPQLLLKGSLLAGVGGVYFDPAPAPREYFIGEELRGNGEFRLGLQYTPFPFTFELSGRYLVREREFQFWDSYISYYGDSKALFLGKQKTTWGRGIFFQPLFFLDFVEDLEVLQSVGLSHPRLWQGSLSSYKGSHSLRFLATLDGRWVEAKVDRPGWYSALALYEGAVSTTSFNGVVGALYRDEKGFLEWGGDLVYRPYNEFALFLASAGEYEMGTPVPRGRHAFGLEVQTPNNEGLGSLEFWYDQDFWWGGLYLSWDPKTLPLGLAFRGVYDLEKRGYSLSGELSSRANQWVRLSLTSYYYGGPKESKFGQEVAKGVVQMGMDIRF